MRLGILQNPRIKCEIVMLLVFYVNQGYTIHVHSRLHVQREGDQHVLNSNNLWELQKNALMIDTSKTSISDSLSKIHHNNPDSRIFLLDILKALRAP